MARSATLWTTVLCLAVMVSAVPTPVQESNCFIPCPNIANPKLKYELKKTYVYDMSASSLIQVEGMENSAARFLVKGEVHLTFMEPCVASLQIKNYRFDDSTKINMTDLPLMLAIVDGQVQHACVHPSDSAEAANVKMGVASQFQNSLPSLVDLPMTGPFSHNLTEMDTQGKCVTNYMVGSTRDEVTKMKNSRTCSDHALLPYPSNMSIPWSQMPLPIYESSTTCTQKFQDKIYGKLTCTQVTIIKPVPGTYKYVKSWQETDLTFVKTEKEAIQIDWSKYKKPVNLTVIYPQGEEKGEDLVTALTKLCNDLSMPIKEYAAKHLVQVVKQLRHRNILEVMDSIVPQVKCEDTQKKTMLETLLKDAVAFTGKAGIPYMVKEITQSNAMGGRTFLYAVALQMESRPNISTIEALQKLFDMTDAPPAVLLASGSVIKAYCHIDPKCGQRPQVMTIMEKLRERLQHSKQSSGSKQELMALLKTVGNMGRVATTLTPEILQLANENLQVPVKVAAIQAFRDIPCKEEMSNGLMEILKRVQEVPEVRVVAYLESVRCLSKEQLREVVRLMVSEPSVQVRNLVLTHLTNLQETATPYKQNVRHFLSEFILPTDYRADITKFSRNIELSSYLPILGTGAGWDTDIIYSNESILPRLMDTDFGAEILHQLKKIVELGVQLEQELSGPTLDSATSSRNFLWEYVGRYLKDGTALSRLLKEIKMPSWGIPGIRSADVFLRMMAQEVLFKSLPLAWSEEIPQFVETTRGIPIDIEYIVPSIHGIPLYMEISGAAVLRLQMQNNLKASNIFELLTSSFTLKLEPSLSIQADGFIGFKWPGDRTGIEMRNKIYAETKQVMIEKRESQLKIGMPQGMASPTLSTKTVILVRGQEKPFSSDYVNFEKKFEILSDPWEMGMTYGKEPEPFIEMFTTSMPLIGSQAIKAQLELSTDKSSIVLYYSPRRTYSQDSVWAKASLAMTDDHREAIPRNLELEVKVSDLFKLHIHSEISQTEYIISMTTNLTPVEGTFQNIEIRIENNLEKSLLNGYAKRVSPQGTSRLAIEAHHRVDARDYTAEVHGTVRMGESEYPYETTMHLPSLASTKEGQNQVNKVSLTWTLPSGMKPSIKLEVDQGQPSVLLDFETLGNEKYRLKIDLRMPSLFSKRQTTEKQTSLSGELVVPGQETLTFDATLENTENRDVSMTLTPWWRRSFLLKAHVPFKSIGDIEWEMKNTQNDQGIEMILKRKLKDHTVSLQWIWIPSKAELKVQTPSRTVEADLSTEAPFTLRFWPDKVSKPDMEYEVSMPTTSTGFQITMKVPNVTKKVEANVNVAHSHVDIEMDIFLKSENRIKLNADFFQSTTGIYRAEGRVISQAPGFEEIPFTTDIQRMPNETSDCYGYMGNFFCPKGQFLVASKMCAPAYIEGIFKPMNSMGSGSVYHAHLGVRDPEEAAFVIDVQDPLYWKPVDVVGLRLQRENPFMVNGIIAYQKEKLNLIEGKLMAVIHKIEEWIQKHGESDKEPMLEMIKQIDQDWTAIYADWKKDKFVLDLTHYETEIHPYVEGWGKLVQQFGGEWIWSPSYIPQGKMKELSSEDILNLIDRVRRDIVETNIWQAFERTVVYTTLDPIIHSYVDIEKYKNELGRDLKKAYDWMNRKHQGRMIDCLIDYLQQSQEHPDQVNIPSIMWDKVKRMVGFGFIEEDGRAVFHVPMVRPLYYISNLPYGFNVPDFMPFMNWTMYLTRAVMWGEYEPWGSVQSWISGDGRIRTFDGLYKKVELSTSPHILAKIDEGSYIELQVTSDNEYQVKLEWEGKKYLVQVTPKEDILVNKKPVKEGDVFDEASIVIANNVGQVVFRLPDMTVTARKISPLVTVDPGVIYKGRLAGLLGTYNDYTADDWVTQRSV